MSHWTELDGSIFIVLEAASTCTRFLTVKVALFGNTDSSNKEKTLQVMAGCNNPGHCLGGCIGNPAHYKLVTSD